MPSSPAVNLLIPTLESRSNYLVQALRSVKPHQCCFKRLVLSVNGSSSSNAQKAVIETGFSHNLPISVISTHSLLSARKHLRFIHNKLRAIISPQELIFLLADDDLLPDESGLSSYVDAVVRSPLTCVGMGNLSAFAASPATLSLLPQVISPGETISPAEFLVRNSKGYRSSSISSMIVPYMVFSHASLFLWYLGSSGRRTEYLFATHRSVLSLYSPLSCSSLIRQHPSQEGRVLSHASSLHDELVYILWVWYNQPSYRPLSSSSFLFAPSEFSASRFLLLVRSLFALRLKNLILSLRFLPPLS